MLKSLPTIDEILDSDSDTKTKSLPVSNIKTNIPVDCKNMDCKLECKNINVKPLYSVKFLNDVSKALIPGIIYNHPTNYKGIRIPETIKIKGEVLFNDKAYIGKGGFGIVYGYESTQKKGGIAVKMIKGNDIDDAWKELDILRALNKSNCNRYYTRMSYVIVQDLPIFIMNLWDGDLRDVIGCVNISTAMSCILQLLKGFACIYENTKQKLLYTDLKCDNFLYRLVSDNSKSVINVVIADIGGFAPEYKPFTEESVATYPPPLLSRYSMANPDNNRIVTGNVRALWPSVYWGLGVVFLQLMGYSKEINSKFYWSRSQKISARYLGRLYKKFVKKNKKLKYILQALLLLKLYYDPNKNKQKGIIIRYPDSPIFYKKLILDIEQFLSSNQNRNKKQDIINLFQFTTKKRRSKRRKSPKKKSKKRRSKKRSKRKRSKRRSKSKRRKSKKRSNSKRKKSKRRSKSKRRKSRRRSKSKLKCNSPVRSTKPQKKRMVKACSGGREKLIHYGASGYGHNYSVAARRSFRARHKCDSANDKLTARYWACEDLWAGPGGSTKKCPENRQCKY